MGTLLFPEYKHSTRIAIVGFAPTTRDQAPYEDLTCDIAGLNEALIRDWFRRKNPSWWFQIHPKFDFMREFNRNDKNHWAWLREPHDFPIFMQNTFREIPTSVRYPLEDVIELGGQYLTNTPAMMVALSILMGYERIEVYGIEMAHASEYQYQKPCMEYWLGIAKGLGIEVVLPQTCSLLRGNLYAYEDLRAADVTYFNYRKGEVRKQFEAAQANQYVTQGKLNAVEELLNDAFVREHTDVWKFLFETLEQRRSDYYQSIANAAALKGAFDEDTYLIAWHDSQNIPADRLSLKEDEDVEAQS